MHTRNKFKGTLDLLNRTFNTAIIRVNGKVIQFFFLIINDVDFFIDTKIHFTRFIFYLDSRAISLFYSD